MDERERFEDLPILGDLREALAAHMREAAAPARVARRSRWAGAGLRRAPVALAVAVALAVVAVGLIALHHRAPAHHLPGPAGRGTVHHPAPANPPPSPGSHLATQAQRQVTARDHACSSAANRGQTIDRGTPPQAMLSVLGVLRRPPLAPDPTQRVLYRIGWDKGAGVYVNYIRRARTAYGRSYWIVPEARTTPFSPIPARCYREFHTRLLRDLRHSSPSLRAQALEAQVQAFAAQRAETTHREGLCFIEIGLHVRPHPGAVGFGCSAAPTAANPLQGGSISGDGAGGTIRSGVVPDGILAVTARFARSGRDPARTVTSDVVNNVYVLKVPPHTAQFPSGWSIRMSDGRRVPVSASGGVQAVAGLTPAGGG